MSDKLKAAAQYVRQFFRSVDLGIEVDSVTGNPRVSIKPARPAELHRDALDVPPETLFEMADKALRSSNFELWICIDRLDVAFEDSISLETNALRALFKVYLDLAPLKHVRLKIFLRSDIWRRISEQGFREASHITRCITIIWSPALLLNLVMKRLLQSEKVLLGFGVERPTVLSDIEQQRSFFYRVFPKLSRWTWDRSDQPRGTGF